MELRAKDGTAVVKMNVGEDYITSLKEACSMLPGTGAVVVSSIGQFSSVSLGYYRGKGDYHPKVIEGPLELLNVSGIISKEVEGPFPHLHAVVGDKDKRVFGGHLLEATVGLTAESVLLVLDIGMTRKMNEVRGTMDLHLM